MADDTVPSGTFGDYSASNANATTEPSNYEICQRSGFRVPAGTLIKEWTGLWVRPEVWEPRHPQDFVRVSPEQPSASVSPEATDAFVNVQSFDLETEAGELLRLEDGTGFIRTEAAAPVSY